MEVESGEQPTDDQLTAVLDELSGRIAVLVTKSEMERNSVLLQGRHFRQLRERQGLSATEVAVALGLDTFHLLMIEHGFPPAGGIDEELTTRLELFLSPERET